MRRREFVTLHRRTEDTPPALDAIKGPALTPLISLTRARARPWSARCYGVARQRDRSRQNSTGSPALTPFISLTRARARPWSARCYGVARQRDRSRQNSTGVSGVLLSGSSGSHVVPKNLARRSKRKTRRLLTNRPCSSLV